jgi:hypothetical protein
MENRVFEYQGLTLKLVKPNLFYRFKCEELFESLKDYVINGTVHFEIELFNLYPTVIKLIHNVDESELNVLTKDFKELISSGNDEDMVKEFNEIKTKITETASMFPAEAHLFLKTSKQLIDKRESLKTLFFHNPDNTKNLLSFSLEKED